MVGLVARLVSRVAIAVFGALFTIFGIFGAYSGYNTGGGWVAIIFGALLASMGLAAVVAAAMRADLPAGLLVGWAMVGLAGGLYIQAGVYSLVFLWIPLGLLAVELVVRRSSAHGLAAAGGGLAAAVALAGFVAIAPALPLICPQRINSGIVFPTDAVISAARCVPGLAGR